jgi:putative lipoprotein
MVRSPLLTLLAIALGAVSASAQTVAGSVTYRERMMLPPTAVVEVTLEDVSRADAPAIAIASTRIESPGAPPIDYALVRPVRDPSGPALRRPRAHPRS